MNRITLYSALASSILIFTLVSSPANAALVKYTYTGNPFSSTYPETEVSPGVTIKFTVDEELLPKNGHVILDAHDYSPTGIPFDFSFSYIGQYGPRIDASTIFIDNFGVDPHFQLYTDWGARIEFNTDADRHLSGYWNANAFLNVYGRPGLLGSLLISSNPFLDSVNDSSIANNPGTWTRTVTPVPLPGGLLFFVSALCGLCCPSFKQFLARMMITNYLTPQHFPTPNHHKIPQKQR